MKVSEIHLVFTHITPVKSEEKMTHMIAMHCPGLKSFQKKSFVIVAVFVYFVNVEFEKLLLSFVLSFQNLKICCSTFDGTLLPECESQTASKNLSLSGNFSSGLWLGLTWKTVAGMGKRIHVIVVNFFHKN